MIPQNLKLHNFTAYGPKTPELDFRPLQLVVLTGNNGAGKSSILDAITWAIWGWSRAGDNADRLVRLGEKEMKVELEFLLDGVSYRVVRTRKMGGVGSSTLEFFAGTNNLTEGTIKSTQEKIIQTLHLSYETFINSSYLRQGHADEFTLKGPTDRKRILADILGLDAYDQLEERAKLKAKDSTDEIALLEIQISELEAELQSSSGHLELQTQIESELKDIQNNLLLADKTINEVLARKEKLLASLEVNKAKAQRIINLNTEVEELEQELGKMREQLVHFKTLLSKKAEIDVGYKALTEARVKLRNLGSVKSKLIQTTDELIALQRQTSQEELEIQTLLSQIKTKGDGLNEMLKMDLLELKEAQANKKKCPLCGSELGHDAHEKVIYEINERIDDRKNQILDLRRQWVELSKKKPAGENDLIKKKEEVTKLQSQAAPAEKIQQQVDQLSNFENQKRELEVASAQKEAIELAGIKAKDRQIKLKVELTNEGTINLESEEVELNKISGEADAAEATRQSLRQSENSIRERLAEAKQLVSRATQLESTVSKKKISKSEAEKIKLDYEELVQAFGKKGIQAMIIESAIPEIEEEANKLLDKLTEGRMQIQLQTQRETKTAGISETLDIVISDELGARAYEMYSGGEAFRINLAIRLALSRLLTQRAGAKLQFLIIDEGFGTQDSQGKDKIVEAINIISKDFEKIFVVTHDQELRESFPQRVEVVRSTAGSTFEVFA